MIRLPAFKRIFPVNRTNVYPFWGESYVDNWTKFENFQHIPNRNGRIYTVEALRRAAFNFDFESLYPKEITSFNPFTPPYGIDDVIFVERTNNDELNFRVEKGRNK